MAKRKTRKPAEFKRAYSEAEKKLHEERVTLLAGEIRKIFNAAKNANERIQIAQKELKALNQDLKDLKAGKLDAIKKRYEAEPTHYRYLDVPSLERIMQPNNFNLALNAASPVTLHTTTGAGLNSGDLFTSALSVAQTNENRMEVRH